MKKFFLTLTLCAMLMFVAVGTAQSASFASFELNTGSTMPSINYGTLTLTLIGSNIDVAINLTTSGAKIVNTGFEASVAFNSSINPDPTIEVAGLPGTYSLVNSGIPEAIGMDGFGAFEYGVLFTAQGGGAGTDSTLAFTVLGSFTDVYQLVEGSTHPPGSITSPFAVDVINQGATGPIGTTTRVPEPLTLLLLGVGLMGIAGVRRFRK